MCCLVEADRHPHVGQRGEVLVEHESTQKTSQIVAKGLTTGEISDDHFGGHHYGLHFLDAHVVVGLTLLFSLLSLLSLSRFVSRCRC